MADETRKYEMRDRAKSQQRTRQRITESAVALHGTLGPARTSMSAVASHAGVRRSTLYRHFPDETALYAACTAHWMAANPLPALDAWAEMDGADERLAVALGELYAYYSRTERMLENVFRDEHTHPLVREGVAVLRGYLDAACDLLMVGRGVQGRARRRVRAALGHTVAFSTWKSLVREQGLPDAEAIGLLTAMVAAASAAPPLPAGTRRARRELAQTPGGAG